jgi:hypothetical protein
VATAGQASLIDGLMEVMQTASPVAAAFAGRAFGKLTGLESESTERLSLEEDPAGDDEIPGCDRARAMAEWTRERTRLRTASRLRSGVDVETLGADAWPGFLDAASRYDACVRERFRARRPGSPFDLERFDPRPSEPGAVSLTTNQAP